MSTDQTDRSYTQISAEQSLAPHPNRVELRGAPSALSWPRICANCSAPADEQIVVRKVFLKRRPTRFSRSSNSGLIDFRIVPAPIPFCLTCANHHRATIVPRTFNIVTDFIFSWAIVPVVGCSILAYLTFPAVKDLSLTEPTGRAGWGLFAIFAAGIAWCCGLWWRTTAPDRVERQTEITLACDFSRDVSEIFEGERHIYAIRSKALADALASANTDRAWTAKDQAHSRRYSWLYYLAVLVAFGIGVWLLSVFVP